jgi:hypothetical protein
MWIVSRLYGLKDLLEPIASWNQLAENLANLGLEIGDDPGRGAVIKFDSTGKKAMVLVRGADTHRLNSLGRFASTSCERSRR